MVHIDRDQYKLKALGLTDELRDRVAERIDEVKAAVTQTCTAHALTRVQDVLNAAAIEDHAERRDALLRVLGHGYAVDHEAHGRAA